ncbi:MAG: hypothetical protein AAF628_13650 [Planctomycetota bacterium]
MSKTPLSSLAILSLGMTCIAQVPPAIVYQDTTFLPPRPGYESALNPVAGFGLSASSSLQQIETRAHAPTPGSYRLAVTVSDPNLSFPGQAGGSDVMESRWNPGLGILQNTGFAAAFNSSQAEFAFSISHDGMVGASDRLNRPQFAKRTAGINSPFASTTFVTLPGVTIGGAGSGFVDTALCNIEGGSGPNGLSWAYVDDDGDISTSDFDPDVAPYVTGRQKRLRFMIATTTAVTLHSPHALECSDGNALAWIASVRHAGVAGDSDTFFFPTMDDSELGGINAGVRIWNDFAWQANGGPRGDGGTLYVAHSAAAPFGYQEPLNISIVGHNAGIMVPGSPKKMSVWVPNDGGSGPWIVGVLFGVTPTSFPLGFTKGNALGNPRPAGELGVIPLPSVVQLPVAPGGGNAQISLPIPAAIPSGLGPFLLTQSFGVDLSGDIFMGNTAWLGT